MERIDSDGKELFFAQGTETGRAAPIRVENERLGTSIRAGTARLRPLREEKESPLLVAQNVHRILGTAENFNHILKGVNISIRNGEYVSIIGPSGSGKSTMLYLLGGLDRPNRSEMTGVPIDPPSRILIDGHDTAALSDPALAMLRNEKVGFVFQFHYLLKEFTAQENVALPVFKAGKLTRKEAMARAAELLEQFGLSDKLKRPANRLSGGEQQRVAIARALANHPAVLLADEPTGNLDRKNSDRVAEIFDELSANGQAIVMVTHDNTLAHRARRLIAMEDGMVISDRILGPHERTPRAEPVPDNVMNGSSGKIHSDDLE